MTKKQEGPLPCCKRFFGADIEPEYRDEWSRQVDKLEVTFVADHGGGYPDAIGPAALTPESRLGLIINLGFRVREMYEMPGADDRLEPWCRLTNDIAVNLANGFVHRQAKGGGKRGKKPERECLLRGDTCRREV